MKITKKPTENTSIVVMIGNESFMPYSTITVFVSTDSATVTAMWIDIRNTIAPTVVPSPARTPVFALRFAPSPAIDICTILAH